MANDSKNQHPIDAVILWVDGNDEKHQEKILPYVADKTRVLSKSFRTRFDQVNEIKFTIDSILKFAPFIRHLYIITDNQIPPFLETQEAETTYSKISIVDHSIIFSGFEEFLPTFNCRPIETCFYKIPELAEHFIYFNDDFFLINPTKPSDFFRNGLPVLRGKWLKFDEDIFYKKFKSPKFGHKTAQQKAAKLVGLKKYYNFKHTPHPLRKSTFETYFKAHKSVALNNIKYRFRNKNQFTPQGLANHIEISNKTCYLEKGLKLLYFRSYKKPLFWYRFKFKRQSDKNLFLGLQSLDLCPPNILNFLFLWLEQRLK